MTYTSRITFLTAVLTTFALAFAHVQTQQVAPPTAALLDGPLGEVKPIQNATTEEAVVLLLARAHMPGGVVEVEPCLSGASTLPTTHTYVFSGMTPRQALDIVVGENAKYKWEARENTVNLVPAHGMPEVLQARIPHFKVGHGDSIESVTSRLLGTLEVQQVFKKNGISREDRSEVIIGGPPPNLGRDLTFDDLTVMEILNTLSSLNKYPAVWRYTERGGKCKPSYFVDWPVR